MNKEEKYRLLTEQIRSLIEGERDVVAVMANVAAAIHETMGFFWTGFYRVMPKGESPDGNGQELVLGPFQGPVACMHHWRVSFSVSSFSCWNTKTESLSPTSR